MNKIEQLLDKIKNLYNKAKEFEINNDKAIFVGLGVLSGLALGLLFNGILIVPDLIIIAGIGSILYLFLKN